MSIKKISIFGMMTAVAFLLSYLETFIPIPIGIQGVKLGLANLVILMVLYLYGFRAALFLSFVRVLLVSLTFGSLFSLWYSLAGSILSLLVMGLAKKTKLFSILGVSILGGVFHNVGQILAAVFVVKTASLFYYLPVLIISGILTGFLIGGLSDRVISIIVHIGKDD